MIENGESALYNARAGNGAGRIETNGMTGRKTAYRAFPAALWQAALITLLGSVIGLAVNAARDGGIPLVGSVRVVAYDTPVVARPVGPVEVPAERPVTGAAEGAPETAADADAEPKTPPVSGGEAAPRSSEPPPAAAPATRPEPSGVEVFSPVPLAEPQDGGDDGGPKALGLDQALELYQGGMAVFVDARMPAEFAAGHIPGALNLPYDDLEAHLDVLSFLPEDGLVVTYCDGSECELSLELADELIAMGFGQVRVFFGGWEQWVEAGHDVEEGEAALPW